VAYYGAPQAHALGALGIGSPDHAVRRLAAQAKPYAKKTRPVMLALELLADVANRDPGRRPLPHAPAREHHQPLPGRGPPRQGAARARHPARARRLPHRDAPPRPLAARARRRPRARPGVAHARAPCPAPRSARPGRGRQRRRPPRRGHRAQVQPAREALRRAPVHAEHDRRQGARAAAARAWP
jgi:hypothetical protein